MDDDSGIGAKRHDLKTRFCAVVSMFSIKEVFELDRPFGRYSLVLYYFTIFQTLILSLLFAADFLLFDGNHIYAICKTLLRYFWEDVIENTYPMQLLYYAATGSTIVTTCLFAISFIVFEGHSADRLDFLNIYIHNTIVGKFWATARSLGAFLIWFFCGFIVSVHIPGSLSWIPGIEALFLYPTLVVQGVISIELIIALTAWFPYSIHPGRLFVTSNSS